MANDLKRAYEHCEQITRSQAKNFYYAFRTLPAHKRRAIYAAYAFCRLCDDIVDEERSLEEKNLLLANTRQLLHQGHDDAEAHPIFTALRDTATAFNIPPDYFDDVIAGVEMDLGHSRFQTFEELRGYCYKVASTVGLISIEIFGYKDPRAKHHAIDLGLAMQLTNIMRDLKEDAQMGRIYIPLDEIAAFGYSEREMESGVTNEAFRRLMRYQVARARRYFDSARRLIPLVAPQSRACPAVLLGFYSALLDRIEASDYDVFQRRIRLTTIEKMLLMARLWAKSWWLATYPQRR